VDEALGERAYREFCWFALVLVALLVLCAGGRLVPRTLVSSSEAGDTRSGGVAQTAPRP
jgi:hypothetical protein